MKALVCKPPNAILDMDYPDPSPGETETLVRVRAAGICRTDLELTRGYMGYSGVLGHEFVGEIVEGHPGLAPGARVVGEINASCGHCAECRRGLGRHCPNRSVLGILNRGGCMAEQLALPHENLLEMPSELDDRVAVFTEPLAAALEIFEQVHIEPHERVCVIGDGKLGLLIAMAVSIRHEGDSLAIGHYPGKLAVVNDLIETRAEREPDDSLNRQWDVVIDATGSSSGLRRAMQLVRPRGRIVLKSTMAEAEALDLTPLVIDEVTVVGSRCGRFAPALAFMRKHKPPLERLIEDEFPLDDADAAWRRAQAPGAKKVILRIYG